MLLAIIPIGCGGSGAGQQILGVSLSPGATTLAAGSAVKFTATVDGGGGVTWQVNGVTGGNDSVGTIDSTGFYSAPDTTTPGMMTITAISKSDNTKMATATVDITTDSRYPTDAMGTATSTPIACNLIGADQGAQNGTVSCYQVNLHCPQVADEVVDVKVNAPLSSKGTISFMTGGGGVLFYDVHFDTNPGMCCGSEIINDMEAAGYTAVQANFDNKPVGYPPGGVFAGWLSGPGGPRKLVCRWATLEKWINDNLRTPSTPMCHTGNSGGAGVSAYALAHYGLDSIFRFIEETSGPPFVRVDEGCVCNSPPVDQMCGMGALPTCYGGSTSIDAVGFLDPSYNPTGHLCSGASATHETSNRTTFVNDSILSPDANLVYPNTNVNFVFGGDDSGSADPQAVQWWKVMTPKNGNQQPITCLAGVTHEIPTFTAGRDQIEADLKANCK